MSDQKRPQTVTARELSERHEQFLECLGRWIVTFGELYHVQVKTLAQLCYREALKNYSAQQIDRGCREAIKHCAFIPKPAEIIKFIEETGEGDYAPEIRALPEPPLTAEESRRILADIRAKAALLRDQPKRQRGEF